MAIDWTVAHEASVQHYEVQRSANGTSFDNVSIVVPTGNTCGTAQYSKMDATPLRGTNFYRVKGVKENGDTFYSTIVKVIPGRDQAVNMTKETLASTNKQKVISVYPNPVIDKTIHVQFTNQVGGSYRIEVINREGQVMYKEISSISNNNFNKSIQLEKTASSGNYELKITLPDGSINVIQLMIK